MRVFLTLIVFLHAISTVAASKTAMPDELFDGMIKFEVDSGNSLRALSLMDDAYQDKNPVTYAAALQGLNIHLLTTELLDSINLDDKNLTEQDYFNIGKAQYHEDRCIPALKSFKYLKNRLNHEQKQEWAYYRANCFIKLGSNARAAQVLGSDLLSGTWIAYAYYNLAIAYAEASTNKRKAIAVLLIADSLNQGQSDQERELRDRINLAAGSLYLQEQQYIKAVEFFNKVYLDSTSSAAALYLRGVAHLNQDDFRAATQAWTSVKSYSLLEQGVAESFLAIPFAYERSGYVGQALEAYAAASSEFKNEIETIDRIESLIDKHGVVKAFIERKQVKGLEWFLSKDIATNTLRASYYSYLMQNEDIYRNVELYSELMNFNTSLTYWQTQLDVFGTALIDKNKKFDKNSRSLDLKKVNQQLGALEKRRNHIQVKSQNDSTNNGLSLAEIDSYLSSIQARIETMGVSLKQGKKQIQRQIKQKKALDKRITKAQTKLKALMSKLELDTAEKMKAILKTLKVELRFNYEKAEHGLVHILETAAEMHNRKRVKHRSTDGADQ